LLSAANITALLILIAMAMVMMVLLRSREGIGREPFGVRYSFADDLGLDAQAGSYRRVVRVENHEGSRAAREGAREVFQSEVLD
jgi:hypothetical protein